MNKKMESWIIENPFRHTFTKFMLEKLEELDCLQDVLHRQVKHLEISWLDQTAIQSPKILPISAWKLIITKNWVANHQRLTSGDVRLILILATGSQVGHSLNATIVVTGDDGISLMWSWIWEHSLVVFQPSQEWIESRTSDWDAHDTEGKAQKHDNLSELHVDFNDKLLDGSAG